MVFGAIDFAAAVARAGKFLGYLVTVCDARPVFATAARFRDADEVIVDWPHRYLEGADVDERTVICVLTHDPKFDVPLLEVPCAPRPATSAPWAAAAPTKTACPASRGRSDGGRTGPAALPDRPGPGGPDPGRDRGLDRGRD